METFGVGCAGNLRAPRHRVGAGGWAYLGNTAFSLQMENALPKVPAFLIIVLGGVGSFWGAVLSSLMVGLAVGITGAYASAWSLMSMYFLLILVVGLRARGLFGRKSVLEN